ncbi:MAG: hypothetical protein FGM41_09485, partial [Bacteroidetes bacterium]|nr:hypothetical protein [Bacteroidota bacterium]
TTTADAEGELIAERPVTCTLGQVVEVLDRFMGPIRQVPPMHSALKKDGKALYEYARDGITVDREPRSITIHSLTLERLHSHGEHVDLDLQVRCSKGTYVRVLGEDIGKALGCGAQYPTHKKDADALIMHQTKPTAIHNNCSGKHAGMLALCKLLNFDTEDYLNPAHSVQQLILNYVAAFYEYPKEKMVCALDGCTAPIYSIPAYHQAICFRNLVEPSQFEAVRQEACKTLVEAISQYPFMVAGSKRYCTDMMQICAPEIIGKTGAEGVFCMAFTKQKLGVCIKIDDGKMLPQYNVAQLMISLSNLINQEKLLPLQKYAQHELKNFNQLVTGEMRVNTEMFRHWIALWDELNRPINEA